jgi:hypothetical protein
MGDPCPIAGAMDLGSREAVELVGGPFDGASMLLPPAVGAVQLPSARSGRWLVHTYERTDRRRPDGAPCFRHSAAGPEPIP